MAILPDEHGVTLQFTQGDSVRTDALIGADGIHSIARTALFGPESPRFTGVVAFRAVVPAGRPHGLPNLDNFTRCWGATPESQIVTVPLNRGRAIFIFATTAQESWRQEYRTQPDSVVEFRGFYAALQHQKEYDRGHASFRITIEHRIGRTK